MNTNLVSLAEFTPHPDSESHVLRSGFNDEDAAKAELDRILERFPLFIVYKEITGWYVSPRAGCPAKQPRLDRLLVPKREIIEAGWKYGAVAIEAKQSGSKLGPVIAQAMDYCRAEFDIYGGLRVSPTWTFIWPSVERPVGGTTSSIMCQHRIGLCDTSDRTPLAMWAGGTVLFRINADGTHRIKTIPMGNKAGSR